MKPLKVASHSATPRRKKYRLTPRALEAMRANLAKARAAPKELIYRPTPGRRAASRANILKAIAARKSPEGNAAARLNALKHGLFANRVEESVRRLKENPKEFEGHLRLFTKVFAPRDELERKLIRRLAETTWRRLRLFHAQARWEANRLKVILAFAEPAEDLSAEETESRATVLVYLLANRFPTFREAWKLHSKVEFLLRALLRKRSGRKIEFKIMSPLRDSRIPESGRLRDLEFQDQMALIRESEVGRELLRSMIGNRE